MRFEQCAFFSLIVMLLLLPVTHAQESKAPSRSPRASSSIYENSAAGLKLLLQDVLVAAKVHNREALDSFVKQMEIPKYEEWFTITFGQEKGESWAEPYERDLAKDESDFEEMLIQFAGQDGDIFTRSVNEVPDPRSGMENGLIDALQRPVDIYYASWKKQGTPLDRNGDFIGYFVFVDGKFRWDSTIKVLSIRRIEAGVNSSSQGAMPAQSDSGKDDGGPFHPGSRGVGYPSCEYCPSPEYPKNDKAKHIEGTVVLQVVVQPYGQATDIKVMKTPDQDFAEMAIEAV